MKSIFANAHMGRLQVCSLGLCVRAAYSHARLSVPVLPPYHMPHYIHNIILKLSERHGV